MSMVLASVDSEVIPPLWRILTKFTAVFVLVVAAFFVNRTMHDRIDNPTVAELAGVR